MMIHATWIACGSVEYPHCSSICGCRWKTSPRPFLFSGHIGDGKTTILKQLQGQLEREEHDLVAFGQADDRLDMSDVEYDDVLLAILSIVDQSLRQHFQVDMESNPLQRFWQEISRMANLPVQLDKAELSLGPFGKLTTIKRTSLEAVTLYSRDDTINSRIHRLSEHLEPVSAAQWLFSMDDWEGGFRIVSRWDVPKGVEYMIPEEDSSSLLVFATKDNPASVRAVAVSVLGRLGGRHAAETVPALLPLLRDPDERVRQAAVEALGQIGSAQATEVVPALLPLLHDFDERVRQAAVKVLGQIGSAQAADVVPALLPLLHDSDERVRQAVAQALGKSWLSLVQQPGQSVYPKLTSQLRSRDSRLDAGYRQATAQALLLWYKAGRPAVKAAETDEDVVATGTPEPTNLQAQHEHAELHKELEKTCHSEPRLWLRSAACQVWIEAHK